MPSISVGRHLPEHLHHVAPHLRIGERQQRARVAGAIAPAPLLVAGVEGVAVIVVVVRRRQVKSAQPVAGVELQAQVVRLLAGHAHGIVARRTPAPVTRRLVTTRGVQEVLPAGRLGRAVARPEVVGEVAHRPFPVDAREVGVGVADDVPAQLFRGAGTGHDHVVMAVQWQRRRRALGREAARLGFGERHQLHVGDAGHGAAGVLLPTVRGLHPLGLSELQIGAVQLGHLPEALGQLLAAGVLVPVRDRIARQRLRRQMQDGEGRIAGETHQQLRGTGVVVQPEVPGLQTPRADGYGVPAAGVHGQPHRRRLGLLAGDDRGAGQRRAAVGEQAPAAVSGVG